MSPPVAQALRFFWTIRIFGSTWNSGVGYLQRRTSFHHPASDAAHHPATASRAYGRLGA
jgi:hypothetical protein